MSDTNLDHAPAGSRPTQRMVCSYDDGYEHSLHHYAGVRGMVEEAEAEKCTEPANHSNSSAGKRALKNQAA
jgi:hypothetical protein